MKEFDEYETVQESGGKSIDLMPYLKVILKSWKRILIWAVCGAVIGIIIGISSPRRYTSKAVVAPEITTRSSMGNGLSSLASLAGVNMNSLALTDAMHPDLYPEVIKSTNFKVGLFDLPVTVQTRDSLVHTDLYDYMVTYNKMPWWGYVFGFPRIAVNAAKNLFSSKKDEFDDAEGHVVIDSLRLTRQQEMVVRALSKSIEATVEKKNFVLSLKVTMQDPVVAAQVANYIIVKLQEFVTSYRTEKARDNVEYFEDLYEETKADYYAAQRAYAHYFDANLGTSSNSSKVRQQQLQEESQLRFQMYNQTAQNLLSARAKLQQESPVLVVIQPGMAPHRGEPSKMKLAIIWFIIGAIGGMVSSVLRKQKS